MAQNNRENGAVSASWVVLAATAVAAESRSRLAEQAEGARLAEAQERL